MSDGFVHKRRVLFGDCDPGGILYTPRASHFVVEAGLEFLGERLGGPPERLMFEAGIAPPARAMSIEFLHPMTWDDELEIAVEVAGVREHSVVFTFIGRVDGNQVFSAELSLVCVSVRSRRPIPVPAWIRSALSEET